MINYQSDDGTTTVVQKEKHLNDGIRLHVATTSSAMSAIMAVYTANGGTYVETHTLYSGETIFNLTEYFRESIPINWRRLLSNYNGIFLPYAFYNDSSSLIANAVSPTHAVKALTITIGEDVHTLAATDLEVVYGYTKFEPSAPVAIHLFNPNFESIAEFTPLVAHTSSSDVAGYTLFGLCYNKANGGEISWYKHNIGSIGYVRQVRLNNYWDDRYSEDGYTLDFITNETATESQRYIIDTRSKGAFLRFMDADGYIQQLLLDIESLDSTYEDGDLLLQYDGGERYFESHKIGESTSGDIYADICMGHGQTAQRTETNVLHCSLTNMPKALTADLKALALSPIVLMYRGETSDGVAKWERVRVNLTNATITEETKKAKISVKIDVYPIFENAWRV